LTQEALEGKIDPLIGREKELNEMIDILGKRRANNPCLIGPPGVGKTALVEGLAMLLAHSDLPGLSGKTIIELDMGGLLAGTHLRGSLAEKLKGIKEEVKAAAGQVIVFIDEVHTLVRAGSTGDSAQDASNDLKTAMSRGEFPCIGATTIQDYKAYIETDPALVRRFHLIWMEEPSLEEAYRIVNGVVQHYAGHHRVQYMPDAVRAAVRLSARFLHDRRLPAKAIDLLDLAGSRARRSGMTTVGRTQVAKVISQLAAVPEEHLLVEDRQRLLDMEEILNERIIGHKPLLADIAAVIRRNYAGFNGPRPIGSFLFLGPPGVGKTETAKTIASFLFHHDHAMLRIDMSEYQDAASVTRLIGAPPGYVGHDEGGQLTEAIRSKPYQLILLDEIEKAHRDVLMLLLQLLDEGTLTDGKGRKVSFSQCVVVMTSNLGSECCENISRGQIGFGRGVSSHPELKDQILESARNQLPLELWGRIDEHLVFAPLQEQEVRSIARLMVERSSKQLKDERNITYTVSERVLDWVILHGGYHPRWGARPMRSTIQRQLEASLAELILKGQARPGACLEAGLDEHGQLCWKMISNTPAVDSAPPAIDSSPPTRRRRSTAPTPPTGFASYSPEAEDDEAEFDLLALPLTH
jgi:ATP-dependent Clp protease ATP-binding subunit ClpC